MEPAQSWTLLSTPRSDAPQTIQTLPFGVPDVAASETEAEPAAAAAFVMAIERAAFGRRKEPSPGSTRRDMWLASKVRSPVSFQPRPNVAPAPLPPLDMRTRIGYQPVSPTEWAFVHAFP